MAGVIPRSIPSRYKNKKTERKGYQLRTIGMVGIASLHERSRTSENYQPQLKKSGTSVTGII